MGDKPGTIGDDLTLPALSGATVSTDGGGLPVLGERYQILSLIGVGGMGTVYKAHDRELDEDVALKVLKRELIDAPGVLARFRAEGLIKVEGRQISIADKAGLAREAQGQ